VALSPWGGGGGGGAGGHECQHIIAQGIYVSIYYSKVCGSVAGTFLPVLQSWNRIILLEPDPQQDAAPAPTALAPRALAPSLMFNLGGLLKMSQNATVFHFSINIFNHFNHKKSKEKVTLFVSKNLACCIAG
jgi:hypothetical protein